MISIRTISHFLRITSIAHRSNSLRELFFRSILFRQTKINELDFRHGTVIREENILILEIPMHDLLVVHECYRADNGPNDASCLVFSVRIASVQVAPGTEFHNDAQLIFMNKGFNGTNDVGMILNE
jgi:hypothetical protein